MPTDATQPGRRVTLLTLAALLTAFVALMIVAARFSPGLPPKTGEVVQNKIAFGMQSIDGDALYAMDAADMERSSTIEDARAIVLLPRQTNGFDRIASVAWTPDGNALVFV